MSTSSFSHICNSNEPDWLLWDSNAIWNTATPNFTLCFQYTVLQWIPIFMLFLMSLVVVPLLYFQSSLKNISHGKLNLFKSVLIFGLFIVQSLNLGVCINDGLNDRLVTVAMYVQAVLSLVNYGFLIFLNRYYYKKGVHTSGVLFLYWVFQLIASTLLFYSRYLQINDREKDVFRTVTVTFELIFVFVSFMTNCFADRAALPNQNLRKKKNEVGPLLYPTESFSIPHTTESKPCPEIEASFLSRITFAWMTGLMLKGYRRTLTNEDLFDLQDSHSCKTIIPRLETNWKKECEKMTHNKKKLRKHRSYRISQSSIDMGYQQLSQKQRNEENKDGERETFFQNSHETQFKPAKISTKKQKKPSFLVALFYTIGAPYVACGFAKLIYDLLTFVQPQLLGLLISYIENENDYMWHGVVIAIALFMVALFNSTLYQQYFDGGYVSGMRARTAVIGMVYRKALRLSSASRKMTTVGEIVNLMSVDAQKIQEAPVLLHTLWTAPITMAVSIYFLWQELGPSVLAGLVLMVALVPFNAFIGSKVKRLQVSQMRLKDKRIKLMNEILNGIKILKLYAWEKSFEEKIGKLREKECNILKKATYLNAIAGVSWFCAPYLVGLCSFTVYVLSSPSNILTANKAFVSLSLFNILNIPIAMLPITIVYGIQAYISIHRVNKFLVSDELDPNNVKLAAPNESPVTINNGNFSWGKDKQPTLTNINLEIPEGSLVAVVGTVGSGKSSLIAALLGEMNKISGSVLTRGSIAYVPQIAWCQNASLQDNIVFSKSLNMNKYSKVLQACALTDDLKILPAGDQTEIGEKGINLSGGQKQRISLARATYQDTAVYLLDDPLSAVDSHVGKHIFNQVIGEGGLLSKKTRILVTHNLTFLPKVDRIIVMADGQISEAGTYKELINNNGSFADYIRTYLEQDDEERAGEEDSEDEARELKASLRRIVSHDSTKSNLNSGEWKSAVHSNASSVMNLHRSSSSVRLSRSKNMIAEKEAQEARINKGKHLIQEEVAGVGSVSYKVFYSYLRSTTFFWAGMTILTYTLYLACSIGANMYLSSWSESNNKLNLTTTVNREQYDQSIDYFLGIYGGLGAGQTICALIQNLSCAYGTYLASKTLHKLLLSNILRAPNSFFDTTPLGRILNRVGKDIDTVDINIPSTIRAWLITAATVFGTVFVVSIATPYIMLALLPLTVIYYFVQRFYICTSRQLKRIDSIKRSPIYSHFSETIVGASSIRAYKVNELFINKCDLLTDENQKAWYPNLQSYRWLQFNLETLGNFVILGTGLVAVFTKNYIGSGLAGLSVSYALQLTGSLNFMVRMSCDLESYSVAVERIQEYADVESEADWIVENKRPPKNWPQKGRVEFCNYAVRYRPGLDLVLKKLNLVVNPGEKLGIVGRTGAGKSSLALALFRLIEPAEGSILIDDIDVSKIGLHDLRSKLTIIPQDPVLFSGTLRMNLDPFNKYSDGELWTALDLAHLKNFVNKTAQGLQYDVVEGGDNLSVGQRQLVCLARALLKKTKILMLDEATAAVDLETDDLIQNSIRRQFKDCTVLTIAHRLNTIMDYDRVLVLEYGQIKELDSPDNLLSNEKSIFYSMARDAGLV